MASRMVVINGLAITAGSSFTAFARIGSTQPINLAKKTVTTRVKQTTALTSSDTLSISISFAKFAMASAIPHRNATLISFQITEKIFLNSTSPSEIARITEVED